MNYKDFLTAHLPDFETKRDEALERVKSEIEDFTILDIEQGLAILELTKEHFSEALQAFANRLCEKQRELCAINAVRKAQDAIMEAEQINILDL